MYERSAKLGKGPEQLETVVPKCVVSSLAAIVDVYEILVFLTKTY